MAAPFKVKAIYEYTSEHEDDLTFPIGQIITVTELEGDEWYVGEYTDITGAKHEGLFPSNFVEKYEPEVPTRPSRPPRAKQEVAQPSPPAPAPVAAEPEEEEPPTIPAASKPQSPPREVMPTVVKAEPPPAPKPAAAEPAEPAPTPVKKAPPPIAAKSNAFKDRIAAFNQPAAAPVAPIQPGRSQQPSNFIKKPFVAPPPSKNAFVPPPKVEPVHKPYVREEDPEIREREEEDRAAAEAVGLGTGSSTAAQGEDEEDAPKPMTLKERMALLQQQQQEQAQRRAEASSKKKPPQKKPSESSDHAQVHDAEGEDLERIASERTERPSGEVPREKPRVPSTQQRPPEPMSPMPAVPDHEILSDGHEADQSGAGDLTEEDDSGTLGPDSDDRAIEAIRPPAYREPEPEHERDVEPEEEEEEEEDEVDEETRRKEELRARMARLGGGMPGMGAPFNPFGAPPPAALRKKPPPKERDVSEEVAQPSSPPPPPRQMIPVPGMQRVQTPESEATPKIEPRDADESDEAGDQEPELPPPPKRTSTMERGAPPPVPRESRPLPPPPQERGAPPVPPSGTTQRQPTLESRPVPPPPPPQAAITSPSPGSESDDEMSNVKVSSADMSGAETPLPIRTGAPPLPPSRDLGTPDGKRTSYIGANDPGSATSEKRTSRVVPPVPGQASSPVTSPRPPPPPPPAQAPPSRRSIVDEPEDDEQVGSDYDGDYDTDIASSAKHKDALKAGHFREASLTDNVPADDTPISSPPQLPPQASAPRSVPPLPPQAVPKTRPSMDRPPPPVPTSRELPPDDEYDPYRPGDASRAPPPLPNAAPVALPPGPPPRPDESSADDFQAPLSPPPRRSTDRAPPPPPQQERAVPPVSQALPPPSQVPGRPSGDVQRSASVRRSTEQGRPSGEQHDQIAGDINLSHDTPWWTAPQPLPPNLQDRNGIDLLSECEETSKSKRGGRKEITKDIYILYMDYSQTVISARYDSHDPSEAQLEQRHEPPPPRLRQDQLEAVWHGFGSKIADAANALGHSKKDAVVGDGSPPTLPLELIKAQPNALLPVGNRAYGALVYANLANASTMQFDEIRRGDIITLRNARFEGHSGTMKTKYRSDYGASHVGIVEEWDGTRRSIRAWEQGREKKGGVRSEKFRLGDLRSGEVRVWRVVGRDWVGWES